MTLLHLSHAGARSAHRRKPVAFRTLLAGLSLAFAAACSGGDEDRPDTAAVSDTGVAGVEHSRMAGMDSSTPAMDADQEFLRKMSDHHEGLVQMLDPAMARASSATAKADAKNVHDKQHRERDQMLALLREQYQDARMPMVMPSARSMIDDLQRQSGTEYDRRMYSHLVMHHREGVQMMDQFLPRLSRPDVRRMAGTMKADQTREIQEFERKAGGSS